VNPPPNVAPNRPLNESPTDRAGSERVTVAVLGSCITRDNFNSRFNPGYKQAYDCVLMQNQSSLISLMSESFSLTEEQLGPASDYDRWNVTTDLSKEFLLRIGELAPDYLVLDFFGDVHFGCLEVAPGRYITNNRWKLWPTPYYKQLQKDGPPRALRIETDTQEYLRLWREAYDRLVEHLRRVTPKTTVVVHRGHNTDLLQLPDATAPVSLSRSGRVKAIDVPTLNRLWTELDDYAVASTGFDVIDLTGGRYPTSPDHPWGPFYVHYSMDYYAEFLARLTCIHLRRVLSRPQNAPGAVLFQQLIDHRQRQTDQELARRDATIRKLRGQLKKQSERVKALEHRLAPGPVGRLARRVVPAAARPPLRRMLGR